MSKEIKLGDKVKDTITDFEGVAIQKSEHLNGCVQFEVMPKVNEKGEIQESVYIDEQQLEIVDDNGGQDSEPSGGGQRREPPSRYKK